MFWSELSIQTLREDNHPLLVRASYRRAGHGSTAEWLELGRKALEKIENVIAEEGDFARALHRCSVLHVSTSRAFLIASDSGDHTLVQGNGYAELLEDAVSVAKSPDAPDPEGDLAPEEFYTPGVRTIAQIAGFTGLPATSQIKSLVMNAGSTLVLVLVRGDHQMSERKFAALAGKSAIRQATFEEIQAKFGAEAGSLGPLGVTGVRIIADEALRGRKNMIAGANKNDHHMRNVTPGRDFSAEFFDVRLAAEGDTCVNGGPLTFQRAKIIASAEDILTAAAEQNYDADGLTLPPSIAPFTAVVTSVHPERLAAAREIHDTLVAAGVDTLLDDRDARPGVKFKDADLIGFPYRVNVGKKLAESVVELITRHPKTTEDIPVSAVVTRIVGVSTRR